MNPKKNPNSKPFERSAKHETRYSKAPHQSPTEPMHRTKHTSSKTPTPPTHEHLIGRCTVGCNIPPLFALIHSLTHSLAHLLAHSLTNSLTFCISIARRFNGLDSLYAKLCIEQFMSKVPMMNTSATNTSRYLLSLRVHSDCGGKTQTQHHNNIQPQRQTTTHSLTHSLVNTGTTPSSTGSRSPP